MTLVERLRQGVTTHSAGETRALAEALARILPPDVTLALEGDLGAGKTTFVQGLAQGLGVTEPVTSPTYTFYRLHPGRRLLIHLDAYRIEAPAQMDALMLEEYMCSPYCLAVEWPSKIAGWLPPDAWRIELGSTAQGDHTLRLK